MVAFVFSRRSRSTQGRLCSQQPAMSPKASSSSVLIVRAVCVLCASVAVGLVPEGVRGDQTQVSIHLTDSDFGHLVAAVQERLRAQDARFAEAIEPGDLIVLATFDSPSDLFLGARAHAALDAVHDDMIRNLRPDPFAFHGIVLDNSTVYLKTTDASTEQLVKLRDSVTRHFVANRFSPPRALDFPRLEIAVLPSAESLAEMATGFASLRIDDIDFGAHATIQQIQACTEGTEFMKYQVCYTLGFK